MIERLLAATILAVGTAAVSAAETPVGPLVDRLRRAPPSSQAFHEIAFRKALRAPLVTSGTYTWLGGLEFERVTVSPYAERARLSNGELSVTRPGSRDRSTPLRRVPQLQILFSGLASILSGDADELARLFEIDLLGESNWRMRLVPTDPELRSRTSGLILLGVGDDIRCAYFEDAGAATLTLLGEIPEPRADAAFEVLVARYCPAP